MALRAKKPAAVQKRMKALFFGAAGVGKTTAAIQFPKPYLIDTERGAENDQYSAKLAERGGVIFQTADFDEVVAEVRSLISERHDYQTLIIDPLTGVYNDLCDKAAKSLATREDPEGMAFGRHKAKADRQVKHLMNLLLRLDMNVIITSHSKVVWGDGMVRLGNTFDCYAKLDYLFDLVFEIQKRGVDRVGIVKKSRIAGLPEGDTFPFNYDEIATRYGREVLERSAVAVTLCSPEQAAELRDLLAHRKDGEAMLDKWLDKAMAETIEEMPADSVAKCIAFLKPATAVEVA
jgi:hypothetical protein